MKQRRSLRQRPGTNSGRGLANESGEVVRYNLAFVCHQLCTVDNGRVLGYDNQHDHHHRHFMGTRSRFSTLGTMY